MDASRRDFLRLSVAAGSATALSGLIGSGVNLGPVVARAWATVASASLMTGGARRARRKATMRRPNGLPVLDELEDGPLGGSHPPHYRPLAAAAVDQGCGLRHRDG